MESTAEFLGSGGLWCGYSSGGLMLDVSMPGHELHFDAAAEDYQGAYAAAAAVPTPYCSLYPSLATSMTTPCPPTYNGMGSTTGWPSGNPQSGVNASSQLSYQVTETTRNCNVPAMQNNMCSFTSSSYHEPYIADTACEPGDMTVAAVDGEQSWCDQPAYGLNDPTQMQDILPAATLQNQDRSQRVMDAFAQLRGCLQTSDDLLNPGPGHRPFDMSTSPCIPESCEPRTADGVFAQPLPSASSNLLSPVHSQLQAPFALAPVDSRRSSVSSYVLSPGAASTFSDQSCFPTPYMSYISSPVSPAAHLEWPHSPLSPSGSYFTGSSKANSSRRASLRAAPYSTDPTRRKRASTGAHTLPSRRKPTMMHALSDSAVPMYPSFSPRLSFTSSPYLSNVAVADNNTDYGRSSSTTSMEDCIRREIQKQSIANSSALGTTTTTTSQQPEQRSSSAPTIDIISSTPTGTSIAHQQTALEHALRHQQSLPDFPSSLAQSLAQAHAQSRVQPPSQTQPPSQIQSQPECQPQPLNLHTPDPSDPTSTSTSTSTHQPPPHDLYTARYTRTTPSGLKEGFCSLCGDGWRSFKQSGYWYHMKNVHGVCSRTKTFFTEPVETRWEDGDDVGGERRREGLCGTCNLWVPLDGARRRMTGWWQHAYICHEGVKAERGGGSTPSAGTSASMGVKKAKKPKHERRASLQ